MADKKTITGVMNEEHVRIEKILDRFEKTVASMKASGDNQDFGKARKIFDEFKWNLQKHLFVEEKAIFEVCNSDCGAEVSEIFELLQEHGEILEFIREIEEKLSMKTVPDVSVMRKYLKKHIELEDRKFYPMLDDELGSEAKQEIFKRADEILWK